MLITTSYQSFSLSADIHMHNLRREGFILMALEQDIGVLTLPNPYHIRVRQEIQLFLLSG